MKLKIKISGEKKLIAQFKKFGEAGDKMVADVTKFKAQGIENTAKHLSPKDFGTLAQNIKAQKFDPKNWRITSFMPYSAFQEFGTGDLVEVPEELKDIAILFKGKGIRKVNLKPQPFMHPAFIEARLTYQDDLKQGLEILTKKFNDE